MSHVCKSYYDVWYYDSDSDIYSRLVTVVTTI